MKRTKKKRPSPLVPKRLGKSMVDKGPARDEKHLAKVREQPCVTCGATRNQAIWNGVEAHHVRCLSPRTMGVCKSDYITTPLCGYCHRRLHDMDEASFWKHSGIDPAAWIASFSTEGAAAIAALAPSNPSGGK